SWRDIAGDTTRTLAAPAPLRLALSFAIYSLQFFALFNFLPVLLIERMGASRPFASQKPRQPSSTEPTKNAIAMPTGMKQLQIAKARSLAAGATMRCSSAGPAITISRKPRP
ncbi:hypothetical protein ACEN8K_45420, partial [Variovorax sp. CT11-76]